MRVPCAGRTCELQFTQAAFAKVWVVRMRCHSGRQVYPQRHAYVITNSRPGTARVLDLYIAQATTRASASQASALNPSGPHGSGMAASACGMGVSMY